MWDLDTNSEIYTLLRPSEFCPIDKYTRTGFIYSMDFDYTNEEPKMNK